MVKSKYLKDLEQNHKNFSDDGPTPSGAIPQPLLWPPPAAAGDTVAVAAPASHVSQDEWQVGVKLLQEWGLKVRCGPEVSRPRAWGIETDKAVARRFQEVWQDPEIKAIIGVRGGYGSLKILPHLDLSALAATPKRFFGFSDLTNILVHLHRRLHLVTFHGPTISHLPALTPAARVDFYQWLTAPGPRRVTMAGLSILHPGTANGPVAGGNLTTLCHLVGTPFAPHLAGYLLFLEDHNEAVYRVDRMLHHLLLAGILNRVRGIILGGFTNCGSTEGLAEVAATALAPLGVPVLAGLPVGHQADNHTIPLGAWGWLDAAEGSLTLKA